MSMSRISRTTKAPTQTTADAPRRAVAPASGGPQETPAPEAKKAPRKAAQKKRS